MQKGFASKNQLLQKVKSSKLVLGISYTKGAKGSNQNSFSVKVGILSWGGGVWPNPNFFQNWPKLNLPWYMAINVMKHTIHKWGGNILWIHEVIGPSNLSSQHFSSSPFWESQRSSQLGQSPNFNQKWVLIAPQRRSTIKAKYFDIIHSLKFERIFLNNNFEYFEIILSL